jgi:hypothetical protein
MTSVFKFAGAVGAIGFALFAGQAFAGDSARALPPKYLSVPEFKSCLSTQTVGSYQSWCLPITKPAVCPADSWARLRALSGADATPPCPRAGDAPRSVRDGATSQPR